MKRYYFLVFLFITIFYFNSQDLSKFNNDQKIIIYGYTILLDGKSDTIDDISQEELKELNNILVTADNDYDIIMDDLITKTKGKMNNIKPESYYIRYEIVRDYKVKLDITKIDKMVVELQKKGKTPSEIRSSVSNLIINFCKGVDPKSKYAKYHESLDVITTLFIKLLDSPNVPNSVFISLQDDTIKKYILTH